MDPSLPLRPAEFAENKLIEGILEGLYPVDATLPAERELAQSIGVTRPTLREALQRLGREGWLEIRQGKPTRVRDFWREGSLGVLSALARRPDNHPHDFIRHLLEVRLVLAPAYAALAVEHHPEQVAALLSDAAGLAPAPEIYASYDWLLHHRLSILSDNPIFTLIVNGFADLYLPMAVRYFQEDAARRRSQDFYQSLLQAAQTRDTLRARQVTDLAMMEAMQGF
jgi:GntR family negative regulator for fad regulon and positive regulator of fabA